jgi:hypothetical protein
MGFFQEQKTKVQAFLDKLTNDAHVPIAIFVFCCTFGWVIKGHDLPPGFVSSLYAFYGFLGGHALVYQKWPDQTNQTIVNVDNTNTNSANANATPAAPAAPATGSDQPKG